MDIEIRPYTRADEDALMAVIEAEGAEWADYWGPEGNASYRAMLADSVTWVAVVDGAVCGYSRSIVDGSFGVYVCDLLVAPARRGLGLGNRLMQCIYRDYPGHVVYVMSDVDPYYEKQGYRREGSVFEVTKPG